MELTHREFKTLDAALRGHAHHLKHLGRVNKDPLAKENATIAEALRTKLRAHYTSQPHKGGQAHSASHGQAQGQGAAPVTTSATTAHQNQQSEAV